MQNFQTRITHYDVELGVDIDQLVLVVHDGQRGDSEVDKLVERLDDGRVVVRDLDVVVGADVEVPDGAFEVARLRQVVYLRGKGIGTVVGWTGDESAVGLADSRIKIKIGGASCG